MKCGFPRCRLLRRNLCSISGVLVTAAVILSCASGLVKAQGGARVLISSPQTAHFPVITFEMDVYDSQGSLQTDLKREDLQVFEDEQPLILEDFQKQQTGLQISIAFNAGVIMTNHVEGISNYDRFRDALKNWFLAQPSATTNDFSFITNTGYESTHITQAKEWAQALDSYQPDFAASKPDLICLSRAIELAGDPMPEVHMKRALLFITPSLSTNLLSALPTFTDRAAQLGVHVFVWVVAQSQTASPASMAALADLAGFTGGQFFVLSGEDPPDMESVVMPLRTLYQLSYRSAVRQSGNHVLFVKVKRGDFQVSSEPQSFNLILLPPNPIFLSPPSRLERVWTKPALKDDQPVLEPVSVPLNLLVEFPDGYARAITRSTLYIDGVQVGENLKAPFDKFEWDLAAIISSGDHQLQIKVEDELGLSGSSIEIPVTIDVQPVKSSPANRTRLIIGGVVGVSALVLLAVILLAGRRLVPAKPRQRSRLKPDQDPVTQPVKVRSDYTRPRKKILGFARPQPHPVPNMQSFQNPQDLQNTGGLASTREATQPLPARLVRLTEDEKPLPGEAIVLSRPEITFGSDPKQAIIVLESISISPLHARVYRTHQGDYMLADIGSTTGTWINYTPVSTQGALLENGDLVHIGRVSFRFILNLGAVNPQSQDSPDA